MERTLFTCECSSLQHMFVISQDDEYICLEILLSKKSFFSRLKRAIGYVFGKRSKYGDFEEILLGPDKCQKLGEILLEASNVKNP